MVRTQTEPLPGPVDQSVRLPDRLDLPAAVTLTRTLVERRGTAIEIDASGVRTLGTQGAQVLASAALTWAADKTAFRITEASPEFCAAAVWLGLATLLAPGEPS